MQEVSREFSEGNFRYTQVERTGRVAIYRQEHTAGPAVRYEVVRILEMPEHTWPNGSTTPAHEYYPGASRWGQDGWTHFTLAEAQAQASELATRGDEA